MKTISRIIMFWSLFAIIWASPAILDELFSGFFNSNYRSLSSANNQSSGRRSIRQYDIHAVPDGDGTKRYKEICRVTSIGTFLQPGGIAPPCPY